MSKQNRAAFTLVELLVVITIIVVLISLLAPALDKAIYQAELTVCAANQHGLGLAISNYVMDNKRFYPYRRAIPNGPPLWPSCINRGNYMNDNGIYDDRPNLKPYMSLNKMLNCALSPKIDIEGTRARSLTFVAENMWFGFQFWDRNTSVYLPGMRRLGDRLETPPDGSGQPTLKLSLLYGTRYWTFPAYSWVAGSHPAETYDSFVVQDGIRHGQEVAPGVSTDDTYTFVLWNSYVTNRGLMDLNNLYADLSVRTTRAVKWQWGDDDRVVRVPSYHTSNAWPVHWEIVPKE